ncbi:hypothetical protein Y032_0432g1359 [Ancylostoma ceylanicum]|uniref:Uncharacterized protein n=1 Tax=Ancylostoma ceylanicum TaxID=53326 RepID=A0A016X1B8_9BILA|nr:hypothetical protein Y032_0432g1359 [Ancylostoma ceylanicum]
MHFFGKSCWLPLSHNNEYNGENCHLPNVKRSAFTCIENSTSLAWISSAFRANLSLEMSSASFKLRNMAKSPT